MTDKDNLFGRKLKEIRLARDMSQEDMAKLLGTTKQVISHYETGQRSPKITTALEYAAVLNVGIEELSGRAPSRSVSPDAARAAQDRERLETLHRNPRLGLLFDRQAKMTEEDVEFMLQMADRILKERDT